MTLYELKENYRAVLDLMEDEEADQEAVADTLSMITDDIEEKAETMP